MRKGFLLGLLACVVLGCASGFAGETELRFSWWGGGARHEATLAALKLFEDKNPGVKVKAEYMGWNGYLERLTTQIGGGSQPDIMQMDWAWLATFSKNGDGFYNLLDIKDVVDLDAWDQKWIDTCMVKGKLNALPISFTTRYFLWNKTIFDRAGIPLPTTWEEIVEAGPKIREKLGDKYWVFDVSISTAVHMLTSYIYQKTGSMIIDPVTNELGLTVEQLEEMLSYYKRLVDNHSLVSLPVRVAQSGDADAQTHEQPGFIEGYWAGTYQWDSALYISLGTPKKEFTFDLGEWPTLPDSKNSGRIGRPAQILGISPHCKDPKAAAACASFLLTTPEAARVLKTTRGVLISNPAKAELEKENLIAPLNIKALEQLEGVRVYTPSPYFEDPRMLKILKDVVENVGYDKITPRQGAEELAREIPRLLRRLTR